ncbi:hypothetical protein T484DRAFT_3636419 [Baffinella frigidus]|nr:hypothetical protein T484DRAFT_3636419 [Cryptophyta sp. CCMP2293]
MTSRALWGQSHLVLRGVLGGRNEKSRTGVTPPTSPATATLAVGKKEPVVQVSNSAGNDDAVGVLLSKTMIRPPIDLVARLRTELVPSRITFYLRLLAMDGDGDGVLGAEDIARPEFTDFIEREKCVFATYMSNLSIVSGLLAFALFSILTTSNPEPSPLVLDTLANPFQIRDLAFAYVYLCEIACMLSIGATFTCIIWIVQCLGQTPMNEDGVWFIIDNNAVVPVGLVMLATEVSLSGAQSYIFLQYGWTIGISTAITCSVMLSLWACMHLSGLVRISRNLRARAKTAVDLFDKRNGK